MARLFQGWVILAILVVTLGALGCATYQTRVTQARDLIAQGRFTEAAHDLKKLAETEGGDQLVYLLDYAVALHLAGDLEASNQALLQAERIAQIQDYHSLSRISGSLLLSEEMVQYKGEDYEKILIHVFLALNFLLLGDLDAAQVETRKINQMLHLYRTEAGRNYRDYPFAYYVSGMIWEATGNYDSAHIDYKRAYELAPQLMFLREDLLRVAVLGRRTEDLRHWQEQYPGLEIKPYWRSSDYGELVFIFQQGWGPRKRPNSQEPRLPEFRPVLSRTSSAHLKIQGNGLEGMTTAARAERILDVNGVAMEALNEVYGALLAKRIAGIGVKAVVAEQVRQKNEALGLLAWLGMNLMDRADLRHWSTLPESLQLHRVFLPVGEYQIAAEGLTSVGLPSGESFKFESVKILPRSRTFLSWRSLK